MSKATVEFMDNGLKKIHIFFVIINDIFIYFSLNGMNGRIFVNFNLFDKILSEYQTRLCKIFNKVMFNCYSGVSKFILHVLIVMSIYEV